jgi:hypothetical protein
MYIMSVVGFGHVSWVADVNIAPNKVHIDRPLVYNVKRGVPDE